MWQLSEQVFAAPDPESRFFDGPSIPALRNDYQNYNDYAVAALRLQASLACSCPLMSKAARSGFTSSKTEFRLDPHNKTDKGWDRYRSRLSVLPGCLPAIHSSFSAFRHGSPDNCKRADEHAGD